MAPAEYEKAVEEYQIANQKDDNNNNRKGRKK